eukprot:913434-Amphidinium_carterae.1
MRTVSTSQSSSATTIVLRPDSMVSFSRWNSPFASVAKVGSSRSVSAANSRAWGVSLEERIRRISLTAAWTTSRSALRESAAYCRANP